MDELEHYGRKVCFRIEGIKNKVNEKYEEVLEKVINIVKESEAEISELVFDRAHCIGPTYTDNDTGKRCKA